MPNLSEGLIQQGIQQGTVNTILNIIKSGISQEEAFRITNIDDNTKQAVLEKLKENDNN